LYWSIQLEEEVAVPPFGEWDDANAASGEKYTGIFNRVRGDRLSPTSSARQPSTTRSEENKVQQVCKSLSRVKLKIQFICSILHVVYDCTPQYVNAKIVSSSP
jgi:hypothetical protein